MKALLYTKIVALILLLAAVVYAITNISTDGVAKFFNAMGIEAGGSQSPGFQAANRPLLPGESHMNLCKTRVHAVVWPNGHKVEEARQGLKLSWQAHDPNPRDIAYLEVEKWFSQHCQIVTSERPGQPGESLTFLPYVTIEFIDRTKTEIGRAADGTFKIENRVFRSDDLASAITDLARTAQLTQVPR